MLATYIPVLALVFVIAPRTYVLLHALPQMFPIRSSAIKVDMRVKAGQIGKAFYIDS
jgi:hypothetical protein